MTRIPSIAMLRAFEAAARHRSFSRAAEELGLTHGAISHRVRELENQVSEKLFVRHGNAMEPTLAAGRYLAATRQSLDLLAAAFTPPVTPDVNTIRIATLPSFASYWLMPRLRQFETGHPGIAVAVDARLENVPLGAGHADAAIRQGSGSWPGTCAERLVGEVVFPVCTADYRARMRIETPADLARCHLLRYSWAPWTNWFAAARVDLPEPSDHALFTDASLLMDAALAGHGVLLARNVLAADALESGRLVRLFDTAIPFAGAYYYVRPHTAGRLSREVEVFGAWLAATLAREFADDPAPPTNTVLVTAAIAADADTQTSSADHQPGATSERGSTGCT